MKRWERLSRQLPRPESRNQLIVVVALLLLLPLLAALQYRWLGQVSEGEREYIKANLRATAERFSRDFDQELTRLYLAFDSRAPSPAEVENAPLEAYTAKYEQWRQSVAHPQLVKTIFLARHTLAQADKPGQLQLHCFTPASSEFTSCDWPAELRQWREQYERVLDNIRRAQANREPLLMRLPEETLGELPALIFPLRPRPPGPGFFFNLRSQNSDWGNQRGGGVARFQMPFPFGFVIVTLNLAYMREEWLPTLVKQHFGGEASLYDVAVASRSQTRQVIFATSAASETLAQPDVTVPLFSLRANLLRNLARDRWRALNLRPPAANTPEAAPNDNSPLPPALPLLSVANAEESGQWQLFIRHRAGSLAAAVAGVRRRNLLISFGILLLLTASLVLLLVSARRAERLAQAQMDFVAGVSHELRTPISVIDAAGYNLTRGHIKDAEQMARYGALIRQESRRLIEMVEQILEFAGAQSPRRPHYDLQPTDLRQVIEEALAAPLLLESGFEIERELPPALPTVQADAAALQRALQNLLSNAIKYSGESRWLKVQAQSGAAAVNITIRDRGVGIPATELSHVFEPFYRGQEARAAQIHGNGLGLSLVKKIIEAHGGQVTVASEAGRGSAFTLSLPVQAE
jgi:signal transduction histidine kinase